MNPFFSPGENGSPEMEQLFIYSPAGLDPGGEKKWGPDLGRIGPDGLNQPGGKMGVSPEGTKNDSKSKKTDTFISKPAHFQVKLGPGPGEAQARSRPALAWPRPRLEVGRPGAQIGYPFFSPLHFSPIHLFTPEKNGFQFRSAPRRIRVHSKYH